MASFTQTPGPEEGTPGSAWQDGASGFRTTHWSMVLEAAKEGASGANPALERLCRTYWYPLYCFVRRSGYSAQEAQDLTQAFFVHLLEKNLLAKVKREKGRFRSFLLACLKNFLSLERQKARAQKRGGDRTIVSLDREIAEARLIEEPGDHMTPDRLYDHSWAVTVLEEALRLVRKEYEASGKGQIFETLRVFLLGEKVSLTYAAVAEELGATEGAVKMMVKRLRHHYRNCLRSVVAATVRNPEQIESELQELLEVLRE